MAYVSIKKALDDVAANPKMDRNAWIDQPAHDLICRSLYQVASSADPEVRGSLARARAAQREIFNRTSGTRRPGTHPAAARKADQVEFEDLTQKPETRQL